MAVSSSLIPFHLYWYFCFSANNLIPDSYFYMCCFLSQICSCNSLLCTPPPKKSTLLTLIHHLVIFSNVIFLEKTFLNTIFKLVFPTPSAGTFSFSIFLHCIFYNFRLHWNCNKCNFFICTFIACNLSKQYNLFPVSEYSKICTLLFQSETINYFN